MSGIDHFVAAFHNAQNANIGSFKIRSSSLIRRVVDIMLDNGYISSYSLDGPSIMVGCPLYGRVVIKKFSSSSRRVYVKEDFFRKNFDSFFVVSTRLGLLTTCQAVSAREGGELLLRIDHRS